MFITKSILNDDYLKALNILTENLKDKYHVFYGMRLSEIVFPASEYGSDEFFKAFEMINGIVAPLLVYDLLERKPVMVIGFGTLEGVEFFKYAGVDGVVIEQLKDLLIDERIVCLYK